MLKGTVEATILGIENQVRLKAQLLRNTGGLYTKTIPCAKDRS